MTTTKTRPRKRSPKKKPRKQLPQLRTSERSTYTKCRWQWDRVYNDRLKPRVETPALRFGTLVHKALEARYPKGIRRGPKPAETFAKLYQAEVKEAIDVWGFRDEDGKWAEALEIGVDMLEMFVEQYGRDEEWEVIASEMTFKVPVLDPETGKRLFYYVGTIDNVLRNRMDDSVFLNDWKTTKNNPIPESSGKFMLDEQATAYWTWGVDALIEKKVLKPRDQEALNGMLYTFLRKARRDPRPQDKDGHRLNQDGTVSKKQPLPYFHREPVYRSEADRENARQRAVEQFKEMQAAKRGEVAIYKEPDTGQTGHCNWCPVRDLCELHEAGKEWEELRDLTMTTWEPYAAHEIEEEGKAQ